MKSKFLTLLSLVAILSMAIAPAVSANTAPAPVPAAAAAAKKFTATPDTVYDESSLKNAVRTPDGRYSVIVQLAEPPLAAYGGGIQSLNATSPAATGQRKLNPNSADSQAYIQHLQSSQAQFAAQLASQAPSAQVSTTFQVAFNGVALTADKADLMRIAMLNGVLKIYPNQVRQAQMDSSLPLIKAAALWAKLGGQSNAGAGIKVADVDTGLDVKNPMFDGTGFTTPPGYPKGYCVTDPSPPAGPTQFVCNGKVIVGRFFYDDNLVGGSTILNPAEVKSPFGVESHGSHTAGTITGRPVSVDVSGNTLNISGVAPAAYLMVYKALFSVIDNGVETGSGTDVMLVAALNAAVADGADVINNSWGGGAGGDPNASLYKPLIAAIQAAGTLVVFSAGNSGPGAQTIGCPGCVEDALTVAASTTNRVLANQFDITGPGTVPAGLTGLAAFSSGMALTSDISAEIRFNSGNALGCSAFPANFFQNAIALIGRGSCTFAAKVTNAVAAGAMAVVVFNNAGGPPVSMSGVGNTTPSFMIDMVNGLAVRNWIVAASTPATAKINAATTKMINNAYQDVIAGFSSVGPDGDPNVLKPDIAAPGVNILSASSPILIPGANEPQYEFLQGTSMAAPHITGSAALLMQQHPDWTPQQVKTALTTSAIQALTKPDGATPADPFDMGSGRVDLARASSVGVTFSKTSFANGNCIVTCSWTTTITNTTAAAATWNASASSASPMLTLTVSPKTVTLPAGASTTFTVTAANIVPSDWYFGSILWKDAAAISTDAYFPVAVRAGDTTSLSKVTHTVDLATANNGDELTYTTDIGNPMPTQTTYTLQGTLPADLSFVDGSGTGGLTYDPLTRKISGTATLDGYFLDVTPTGSPTQYVAGNPANALLDLGPACPGDTTCDETVWSVTGFNFTYLGSQVTTVKISSNGWIAPEISSTSSAAIPQNLPNTAGPNNVIAPLWSDLQFSDPNAHWFIWGTPTETIIEWQKVNQFASMAQYNFEIRIVDGTNQISFAYGPLDADVATPTPVYQYEVGFENVDGTAGKSYYYSDGIGSAVGTAPAAGVDLNVVNTVFSAEMTFKADAASTDPINKPLITDMVSVFNNQDATVQSAAAYTLLNIYQFFSPLVGK